jgi:hypothetical protein
VTFSFTAVGRPDDVIRQIRSHHANDDQLAVKVRDLITDAIAAHSATDETWPGGGGWAYVVKASGYSGHHSSVMVSLSIESMYVPGMGPAEARAETSADGEPEEVYGFGANAAAVLDPQVPPRHECEHQASNFTPCRVCGA